MPKVLPENIKYDILSTTRRLMVEQGYNKISIRDITQACGIATGTFYNYYNSKQEVLSALINEEWNKLRRILQVRSQSSDLTVIMQLEKAFLDLQAMTISMHELWALGFPEDFAGEAMTRMAQVKKQLIGEFAQSVQMIIHGHIEPEHEAATADFIARMFFNYAYDGSSNFTDIRFILEKVLD